MMGKCDLERKPNAFTFYVPFLHERMEVFIVSTDAASLMMEL